MIADVPLKRRKDPKGHATSTVAWRSLSPGYGPTTLVVRLPTLDHPQEPVESRPSSTPSIPADVLRYMTIKALAYYYKEIITESALRHLVWQAEAYAKHPKPGLISNGFLPVIVRPPKQRKVLLDRYEFEKWLTSGNSVTAR